MFVERARAEIVAGLEPARRALLLRILAGSDRDDADTRIVGQFTMLVMRRARELQQAEQGQDYEGAGGQVLIFEDVRELGRRERAWRAAGDRAERSGRSQMRRIKQVAEAEGQPLTAAEQEFLKRNFADLPEALAAREDTIVAEMRQALAQWRAIQQYGDARDEGSAASTD
jgi:hypothetical protein